MIHDIRKPRAPVPVDPRKKVLNHALNALLAALSPSKPGAGRPAAKGKDCNCVGTRPPVQAVRKAGR